MIFLLNMVNDNEYTKFKATLLNEFYDNYNVQFTKPVFKEMQKFTDDNINTATLIKYNHYINILQYICLRASGIPRYFELFDFLVQKGININFFNQNGISVMDYALSNKKLDLIHFIIQNDKFVKTPQIINNYINNHSFNNSMAILLLYEAGGDITPVLLNIITDIRYMPKDICEMYIEIFFNRLNVQPSDNDTMNFILFELAFGNKLMLLNLLKKYETLNVKAISSFYGITLLHSVCNQYTKADINICIEIIKLLLQRGLDINSIDTNGQTAFHLACGNYTLINFLVQNGMKPVVNSEILSRICKSETSVNAEKIIKLLDINEINEKNLLHSFIVSYQYKPGQYRSQKKHLEDGKKKINMLVKLGIDPKKKNVYGFDSNHYMFKVFKEKLF